MAQLSNDCFGADEKVLRLDEGLALVRARVTCAASTEDVLLADAAGRILAADMAATTDLPPFDNSAVDGYAVRFGDLAPGRDTIMPVGARLAAGSAPGPGGIGTAIRIFTGAKMPDGFDTVFMQEDVGLDQDGSVRLPTGLKRGDNRREAGEDLARAATALSAGRRLAPMDLALLGALGAATIPVRTRLRVAVFSTGNELATPGAPIGSGQRHDANRPMLVGWLGRLGCSVSDLGTLPDRRETVSAALGHAARDHDIIVTSGGVSVGDEDHVRAVLAEAGRLTFWRLAIKPGRPVALGVIGGAAFLGLPGNPVAAFVMFATLGRTLLARLGGETEQPILPFGAVSGFSYRKKVGRREYLRVSLSRAGGRVVATKHPREGAAMITSLTETDALAVLDEDLTEVDPGDTLAILPYASLLG